MDLHGLSRTFHALLRTFAQFRRPQDAYTEVQHFVRPSKHIWQGVWQGFGMPAVTVGIAITIAVTISRAEPGLA